VVELVRTDGSQIRLLLRSVAAFLVLLLVLCLWSKKDERTDDFGFGLLEAGAGALPLDTSPFNHD